MQSTAPKTVSLTLGIVHLNSGSGLNELMSSLLPEAHRFVKIHLIDHGSTDDSLNFLKHFHVPTEFVVQTDLQNNLGYSRQKIVDQSLSDWIVFLDSDNILSVDWIDKVFQNILQFRDSHQIAGFCGTMKLEIENFRFLELWQNYSWMHLQSLQLMKSNPEAAFREVSHLPGGGGVYRKSCLEAVGGFSRLCQDCGEDLQLGARLTSHQFRLLCDSRLQLIHRLNIPSEEFWLKRAERFGWARGFWLVHYPSLRREKYVKIALLFPLWGVFGIFLTGALGLAPKGFQGSQHLQAFSLWIQTAKSYAVFFWKGVWNGAKARILNST